ncbi:MAG: GNAT family N-acetyltransferase, partial [Pseudomonadota bacterium]
IAGFGTIRKCNQGYKIGPLFCFKSVIAEALLSKFFSENTRNEEVFLDVPASNSAAINLVENAGFEPVFETARMVRGAPPNIDWQAVYGITSFELG